MKIHQSISHLTGREQSDLRKITARLVETLWPELIFCYGSRVETHLYRSCFTQKRRTEICSAMYDLVIIVSDHEKSAEHIIAEIAERLIIKDALVNVLVHREGTVYNELEEGNFFFSWLFRSAIILHDKNGALKRMHPGRNKNDCFEMYPLTVQKVKQHFDAARNGLTLANEQVMQKSYSASLYTLKQAALASCRGVIMGCLGYEMSATELEKLICHTLNFSEDIFNVFPMTSKEEQHLFALLSKATPAGQNSMPDNAVNTQIISTLVNRVEQLQQTAQQIIQLKGTVLYTRENL